ncbi:DNA-binding NarL/FixJ family response regulator [Nocardioides cavernae]|uniref:DNA-binding NarL/FixJ family response regulator n=1 Tax=Nocardioides cavernae TaxID=1921566 RepID=A0A7Y9GZG2_9ACTN|nr:response regulator transcription factor [Nocardioides cavernae]NYE35194.1 DNA-binding NarL/FixJ family response regulator [Nocardioides cavernae]
MIRVLLVDDDPLVRSALSLMLGGQSDIEVVGEAPNGEAGLALVGEHRPDVVLMDIRMPVMDGLEATRVLHSRPSPPAVVVLTTFDADDHVLRAVAAGADGFLLKDTPPGDIVSAIRTVAAGDPMLSPSATRSLVSRLRSTTPTDRTSTAADRLTVLTERELEVAVCVGRGLSNSEIASELYLSIPTVKSHVSRLLTKLDSTNRVQVAMVVHDAGLV